MYIELLRCRSHLYDYNVLNIYYKGDVNESQIAHDISPKLLKKIRVAYCLYHHTNAKM